MGIESVNPAAHIGVEVPGRGGLQYLGQGGCSTWERGLDIGRDLPVVTLIAFCSRYAFESVSVLVHREQSNTKQ